MGIWYVFRKVLAEEKSANETLSKELSNREQEDAMMKEIRSLLRENDVRSEARSAELRMLMIDQGKILTTLNREVGEVKAKLDTFIGQFH